MINLVPERQDHGIFSELGNRRFHYVLARTMSVWWKDSRKSNVFRPHVEADSLLFSDGGASSCVSSNSYRNRFFDGVTAVMGAVGNFAIGFKHQNQRFFKVLFGFSQSFTLRVYTSYFLNVSDVPFSRLNIYRGKLTNHNGTIPCEFRGVKCQTA